MPRRPNLRTVIITGLSGSGKSTALNALEDIGFYCVDNLPVALLPAFLGLQDEAGVSPVKVGLVMDLRAPQFLEQYARVFDALEDEGFNLEIVFLEADSEALIKRYSTTRRPHPLDGEAPLRQALTTEAEALAALRARAGVVIDTSTLSSHELKSRMTSIFSSPSEERKMNVYLMSFGFKYGAPREADLVMDVRFLPNPYFVEGLREKTGLTREIQEFLEQWAETNNFLKYFGDLLQFLLPLYEKEGKAYLTIAIGCTGGKHRSVAISEKLHTSLTDHGFRVELRHRDIDLE